MAYPHNSGHPSAAGGAQDRESSPARDRRSTTVPRHQQGGVRKGGVRNVPQSCNRLTGRRRQHTDRPRGGQSTVAYVVAYFDRYIACNVFRHILLLKLFYTSADERTPTGQLITVLIYFTAASLNCFKSTLI